MLVQALYPIEDWTADDGTVVTLDGTDVDTADRARELVAEAAEHGVTLAVRADPPPDDVMTEEM